MHKMPKLTNGVNWNRNVVLLVDNPDLIVGRMWLCYVLQMLHLCSTVYATTAASDTESSYACYYSKKYRTYLGDVYSVKWMEDSDAVSM